MHISTILAALPLLSLALGAPTNSTHLEAHRKAQKYITYCSAPGVCAKLPVTSDCTTLDKGYTLFLLDDGVDCNMYTRGSCHKRLFAKEGRVPNVKGFFDVTTSAEAKKHGVTSVQSFWC